MAEQFISSLAAEFPEFIKLNSILQLARRTWPRVGLSAADLSQMDDFTLEMLRVALD
jgi:hypothetical protein